MFAQSPYVRRVTEYAIDQSHDLNIMRKQPGYILGSLAHAHPFLDGNGRTILSLPGLSPTIITDETNT